MEAANMKSEKRKSICFRFTIRDGEHFQIIWSTWWILEIGICVVLSASAYEYKYNGKMFN